MNRLNFKTPLDARENKNLRDSFSKLLSERLRKLRTEKRMTQQELSEKSGLHLTYIGHLEAGKYHPTFFVVWKISKALGISIDDLVDF